MQFNTYEFAVFFLVVYGLYLCLNHRGQNILLLAASYFFYGWWDWRFLPLLIFSTAVAYICGSKIGESDDNRTRRLFLILGISINLCVLAFFKYFNFFADNFQNVLGLFGLSAHKVLLKVLLPIGISFYTFQKMSYLIDIYRREMKPTKSFIDFALFAAYFPQLVAGPIERATRLLPQVLHPRKLEREQVYRGCYLIFWGLFKKVFIADNCARIVDKIFSNTGHGSGGEALIGIYAFAFQIYGDFSGYSDMARGLAKLMGFDLMVNFNLPYFAENPSEFWRKWHISLSSWLRDYLYIPLGGNRRGNLLTYRNLLITMVLAGLWHGAAWTYILWGLYMGLLLAAYRVLAPYLGSLQAKHVVPQKIWSIISVVVTFHLICLGWLFFRAQSIGQVGIMLSDLLFNFKATPDMLHYAKQLIGYIWPLIFVQVVQVVKKDLEFYAGLPSYGKAAFLSVALYLLIFYGTSTEAFIYFQF